MDEVESGMVDIDAGGRLYYEVAGQGPAVALVHPGLWDSRTWDDQFDVFAERHRVLRYDLRGFGRSSLLDGSSFSYDDDLVAVLDHVGMERFALVGCSVGGGVALDFALEHPDRVTALVLVAAGVGGFEPFTPEEEAWWAEREGPIEEAIAAGDLERAQDLRLEIWAPLGTDDEPGARIRAIAFDNLQDLTADESGYREIEPPAFQRLEEISVPTLLMPADLDPPEMIRLMDEVAERIPGAITARIKGVDHVVNMRRPAEFNEIVLNFLAQHPG